MSSNDSSCHVSVSLKYPSQLSTATRMRCFYSVPAQYISHIYHHLKHPMCRTIFKFTMSNLNRHHHTKHSTNIIRCHCTQSSSSSSSSSLLFKNIPYMSIYIQLYIHTHNYTILYIHIQFATVIIKVVPILNGTLQRQLRLRWNPRLMPSWRTKNGWFLLGKIRIYKWMMTGGSPMTKRTPPYTHGWIDSQIAINPLFNYSMAHRIVDSTQCIDGMASKPIPEVL